jgi:hypothetical protein
MSLQNLGLRISNPPDDLVTKVRQATESAIPSPSPIDDEGKGRGVSMDDSESVVSSESPPLPSHEPYWVTDIEPSLPPPVDEAPPSPPSTPEHPEEETPENSAEELSDGQTSIETRLLFSSFPLACSTILLVIDSAYGTASAGWLILGGLAWSGIILSAGIILKTVWDCVRKS